MNRPASMVTSCLSHGRSPAPSLRSLAGPEFGTLLKEQVSQNRPVTASLVLAVATHREVRVVRQHSQQFSGMIGFGLYHFGPVSLHKPGPLRRGLGSLCQFHRFETRCQVRKPHVVPIFRCKVRPWNTTRWKTYGSDTNTLSFDSRRPKPNNTDNQGNLLTLTPNIRAMRGAGVFGNSSIAQPFGRWSFQPEGRYTDHNECNQRARGHSQRRRLRRSDCHSEHGEARRKTQCRRETAQLLPRAGEHDVEKESCDDERAHVHASFGSSDCQGCS